MFQDLNRKLHHAEKDRESPASDTKVTHLDELLVSHSHRFLCRKCRAKKREKDKKIIKFENHSRGNSDVWGKKNQIKAICADTFGCHHLEVIWIRMHFLPSFLQSVRWSVSSGGSDKTNHSVSVYIQPHMTKENLQPINETQHQILQHLPHGGGIFPTWHHDLNDH